MCVTPNRVLWIKCIQLVNHYVIIILIITLYYDVTSILFHFGVPELQASTQGDWFKNVSEFLLSLDRLSAVGLIHTLWTENEPQPSLCGLLNHFKHSLHFPLHTQVQITIKLLFTLPAIYNKNTWKSLESHCSLAQRENLYNIYTPKQQTANQHDETSLLYSWWSSSLWSDWSCSHIYRFLRWDSYLLISLQISFQTLPSFLCGGTIWREAAAHSARLSVLVLWVSDLMTLTYYHKLTLEWRQNQFNL